MNPDRIAYSAYRVLSAAIDGTRSSTMKRNRTVGRKVGGYSSSISKRGAVRGARLSGRSGFPSSRKLRRERERPATPSSSLSLSLSSFLPYLSLIFPHWLMASPSWLKVSPWISRGARLYPAGNRGECRVRNEESPSERSRECPSRASLRESALVQVIHLMHTTRCRISGM